MNFLSFMVYFRGGELYFSSPLVRSDKEPALPIFFWADISNSNDRGAESVCLALGTFCMYNLQYFVFSKNRFTFQCKLFYVPLSGFGGGGIQAHPLGSSSQIPQQVIPTVSSRSTLGRCRADLRISGASQATQAAVKPTLESLKYLSL